MINYNYIKCRIHSLIWKLIGFQLKMGLPFRNRWWIPNWLINWLCIYHKTIFDFSDSDTLEIVLSIESLGLLCFSPISSYVFFLFQIHRFNHLLFHDIFANMKMDRISTYKRKIIFEIDHQLLIDFVYHTLIRDFWSSKNQSYWIYHWNPWFIMFLVSQLVFIHLISLKFPMNTNWFIFECSRLGLKNILVKTFCFRQNDDGPELFETASCRVISPASNCFSRYLMMQTSKSTNKNILALLYRHIIPKISGEML